MTIAFPLHLQDKERWADWCATRIPHVAGGEGFGHCQPCVIMDRGQVQAVIVFHDWQPEARTMQVSGASVTPRWATRRNIATLYDYVFNQAGAWLLWAATPADLPKVYGFDQAIGMTEDARLRDRFGPGRDAVITSITADEWRASRWCKEPVHGQIVRQSASAA